MLSPNILLQALAGVIIQAFLLETAYGQAAGSGADPANLPAYVVRSWLREDGLPQNAVTEVIQTRDGYIWVATYNGLARFDGVQFVTFNTANTPELRSSRITCLYEARDGSLWIGHEGGEVTRYANGRFEPALVRADRAFGKLLEIAEDEQGDIWLVNVAGLLSRLKDGRVLTPEKGSLSTWVQMVRSGNGRILILCEGRVSELSNGELKPLIFGVGADNTYVLGIGASRDGGFWVFADNTLRKWKKGIWSEQRGPSVMGGTPCQLSELNGGIVAGITTDKGLVLDFPQRAAMQMSRGSGFPSDWLTSLCEDREGNLWIGTGGAGLVKVRASNLSTIASPDKWQGRAVLAVRAEPRGGVWIGTEGAGLYHYDHGAWANYSVKAGLENPYVWSVTHLGTELWVGSWGGGLFVRRGEHFQRAPGLEHFSAPIPALLPSSRGGLWVGTGDGLMLYATNGSTVWFGEHAKPIRNDVRCIAEDPTGTVWFGTAGNGLFRLTSGAMQQFRKSEGLPSDFIQCLRVEGDSLWIGTAGGGLCRLKHGDFSVVNSAQGLVDDVICHIEDDGLGFLWFSSYNGVFRISKVNVEACADRETATVECVAYGISDGMPTIECSGGFQPAGGKLADGRLLFSTSRGLVVVDPALVKQNKLAPPVVIESLLVDGQPARPKDGAARVTISPGWHQFEFHFTALSFVAPERVRFKYRLEGLDPQWTAVTAKRSVTYNYLPPGEYVFQVIASNNDDVWNETGAVFAFTVRPHFWQTAAFQTFSVLALIAGASGSVWYAMRRRMRLKLERVQRQRAIERERTRIAKDIHDDLGASLTRIGLLSQSVQQGIGGTLGTSRDLQGIQETARQTVRALDEIVWAVDPQHDTFDSLVSYLGRLAQTLANTAGIRCRLDFPDFLPQQPVTAEVRHNLFLGVKEALNNVIKHSGASEMRLSLRVDPEKLVLMVEDDGKGFDPTAPASARHSGGRRRSGLVNMFHRLEEIGGTFELWSEPGKGTRTTFIVRLTAGSEDLARKP